MRARCLFAAAPAVVLFLLAQPFSAAQTSLYEKLAAIEQDVDAKRQELHVAGAALAIVKDGKVILRKGFGLRNVEENLPVTPRTQFAIGSSSKAFTAVTVMMCADEGKLALTDSPKKHLPFFKINDPDIDAKITVGDLLSHRSGLDRTDIAWYTGKLTPREIIQVAGEAKPTAKLGERFQYQNIMFLAAGEIVAAAQKKPWRQFLAERIFQPLGMRTSNTDILDMKKQPEWAAGYAWDPGKSQFTRLNARQIRMIAPAGAINSNVDEMSNWLKFLLDGGVFDGKRLLSEKSFAELTVPRIPIGGGASYGYGWMLRKWGSHQVVEHGGNIDGYNAQVALMPDQKLGLVLLTNISASPLGSFTMDTVWEHLVGGGPKKPAVVASGTPSEPAKEVGVYKIVGAPVTFDVTMKDGRLTLTVSGQPPYPLVPLGGRRYKLGSPAPDGFFATFRPNKEKTNLVELYLEQPQGNVVAMRDTSSFKPPLSVEELMRKVVDARGGAENLRKTRSMTRRFKLVAANQGIRGDAVDYYRPGGGHVDELLLEAAGKRIARIRDCFDGKRGSDEVSFVGNTLKTGKALANSRADAVFAPELDWKTRYKQVTITQQTRVGDEECHVVEKIVDGGDKFVDYISTRSFLPIKMEAPGGGVMTLKDYRDVEGVKIAHRQELTGAGGLGNIVMELVEARLNARINSSAFRVRASAGPALATADAWAFATPND